METVLFPSLLETSSESLGGKVQKYYKLRSEFNGAVNVDPSDGLDEVVPEGLAIEVALLMGVHAHGGD